MTYQPIVLACPSCDATACPLPMLAGGGYELDSLERAMLDFLAAHPHAEGQLGVRGVPIIPLGRPELKYGVLTGRTA